MYLRNEERVCCRFCAILRERAKEILAVIKQASVSENLSPLRVFDWHAEIKTGQASLEDDQHTVRLISSTTCYTVAKLHQFVYEDQCCTIQDLVDVIGNCYGSCQWSLTAEFGMLRIASKCVPRILTGDQKQQCLNGFIRYSPTMHLCYPRSSLVMRFGFMVMTLRQRNNLPN
jgi:hypothetical protein